MSSDELPSPLRRARALDGVAANVELYARWADTYDHDVFEVAGVTGTARIADLLAEHLVDRSSSVLDLGCGTGAAGARLGDHGFTTIDGVDLSPEMLEVAARRGVYRRLEVADLTARPLAITGGYDATIAAGVLTTGHVGATAVAGLVALVRPGGLLAWVVADPLWPDVERELGRVGAEIRHVTHEPIRRDAAPEARLVVAARPATAGLTS